MKKWLKKLQTKGFVAGFLVTTMLSVALVMPNAATITQQITYGIRVMLNGNVVNFPDDSRPFVMEGRTFLPLRALAELLDLPVDFDPNANMAILGQATTRPGTPVSELFFDGSSSVAHVGGLGTLSLSRSVYVRDEVRMGGNTFSGAAVFHARNNSSLRADGRVTQSAMLNLNGRYSWFNGSIGRVDGSASTVNATVNIFVDDRLVESFEQYAQSLPRDFRLFVEGARSLRVEVITTVFNNQEMAYAFAGFAE